MTGYGFCINLEGDVEEDAPSFCLYWSCTTVVCESVLALTAFDAIGGERVSPLLTASCELSSLIPCPVSLLSVETSTPMTVTEKNTSWCCLGNAYFSREDESFPWSFALQNELPRKLFEYFSSDARSSRSYPRKWHGNAVSQGPGHCNFFVHSSHQRKIVMPESHS